MLFGLPWWAWAAGTLAATASRKGARRSTLRPAPPRRGELRPEDDPPGLEVWGGTYVPGYIRWVGCRWFRWGFCTKDWLDQIKRQVGKGGARYLKFEDAVLKVLKWAGYGQAQWVLEHFCLIYKFNLRRWQIDWQGDTGDQWEVHRRTETLAASAPPHPLQQRSGWLRCWYRAEVGAVSTRNEHTIRVLFSKKVPENTRDLEIELLSSNQIRGMLRMDQNFTSWMRPRDLAAHACGTSTMHETTRKTAMANWD